MPAPFPARPAPSPDEGSPRPEGSGRRDLSGRDPQETLEVRVHPQEAGMRADRLLARRAPFRSRSFYRRCFLAGQVTLDGVAARPSTRVTAGALLAVRLGPDSRPDRGGDLDLDAYPLEILHEDAHLLALAKPAGIVVHPVGGYRTTTLLNVLHRRYRRPGRADDVVPTLAHRLDRDTSGVLLVGLSDAARGVLAERAGDHRITEKTYLALVAGVVEGEAGTWQWAIGRDRGHHVRLRMRVDPDRGQPAQTEWRVRGRGPRHTWLELRLITGRKHQIRVHAAWAGHPVVADRIYGNLRDPTYYEDVDPEAFARELASLPMDRHALHAWRVRLPHPIFDEPLSLEAPPPEDLRRALRRVGIDP